MVILIIVLLTIVYYIIGRVVINYLCHKELMYLDETTEEVIAISLFPIILMWEVIKIVSDYIVEKLKLY